MTRLRTSILPLSLLATSLIPLACGSSSSPPAVCSELESYTPTTTNQVSFATEIYPLLASTNALESGGCSQASVCHGNPPLAINATMSKTLQFLFDPPSPAMAKAQLLMASVNASGMQRVSPGSVKNSLMSYKISGKEGLACISSMCQANASVGTPPCGDAMPSVGMLAPADRTKILDWIASGASD